MQRCVMVAEAVILWMMNVTVAEHVRMDQTKLESIAVSDFSMTVTVMHNHD